MEETIAQLKTVYNDKTMVLKSDRIELERQYKEIEFMSEFLRQQADETAPVEFLQLFSGHMLYKSQIYKQRVTVSDI